MSSGGLGRRAIGSARSLCSVSSLRAIAARNQPIGSIIVPPDRANAPKLPIAPTRQRAGEARFRRRRPDAARNQACECRQLHGRRSVPDPLTRG